MAVNIISSLATTSQDRGLTESAFKAKFDETPAAIKTYLNDTLTEEIDIALSPIAGVTATPTELNYVDGVTSAIQTQFDAKAPSKVPIISVTASKTLALSDAETYQDCNHGSTAINITISLNSAVAFPVGTNIAFEMSGAAQVAFVITGGVAVQPSTTLKISAKYKTAALLKKAENTWIISGSLKA